MFIFLCTSLWIVAAVIVSMALIRFTSSVKVNQHFERCCFTRVILTMCIYVNKAIFAVIRDRSNSMWISHLLMTMGTKIQRFFLILCSALCCTFFPQYPWDKFSHRHCRQRLVPKLVYLIIIVLFILIVRSWEIGNW